MTRTLATYVSFLSTGYLRIRFPDFCCFHVYPKRRVQPEAYQRQLRNLAGDRPLAMAEIGLGSRLISRHRCDSLGVYSRQQRRYSRAVAPLGGAWPSEYNIAGYVMCGRIYRYGGTRACWPWRIYESIWGNAVFQRRHQPGPSVWLPLMPEWCLVVAGLILLVTLRTLWARLRYTVIFRGVALLAPLLYAANTVTSTYFRHDGPTYRVVTLGLNELQACARAQALLACALQMLEAKEI
jgi:hypothetical protein